MLYWPLDFGPWSLGVEGVGMPSLYATGEGLLGGIALASGEWLSYRRVTAEF